MICSSCGGFRWVRYFAQKDDGTFEEAFALCDSCPDDTGRGEPVPTKPKKLRNDLWTAPKTFDYGPAENARLWKRAEVFLDALCEMIVVGHQENANGNEALVVALTDCRTRVREEMWRAEAEM